MLIDSVFERLCDGQRLVEVEPLDWRSERKRRLYVTQDVNRFLTFQARDAGTNRDRRRLQALFDRFISGDFISIGLEPPIMATDIKRLSPASAEVWEFKVGRGRSQLRVFGRFAAINTFVALTGPVDRRRLDYERETTRCREEWRRLFDEEPPLYGKNEYDYIAPNGLSLRDT
jgi:hypothetical protein